MYQETEEQKLRRELAEAQAKLDRLQKAKALNLQISEKGAISLYGMGKYPITLYANQWEQVIALADVIDRFIRENASKLARKEPK